MTMLRAIRLTLCFILATFVIARCAVLLFTWFGAQVADANGLAGVITGLWIAYATPTLLRMFHSWRPI